MGNQDLRHVVTGRARLSYVHLFTPHASQQGATPKYSTTLLIHKSDVATRQRIDAAINAAIQQGINEKFGGVRPPVLSFPIHDGDGPRPSDGSPFGAECKGHWVLTASSNEKPEIVDQGLNPIMNQTEVYSGMYARASIRFFAFSQSGKKGIGCGLGAIQKMEDGEPLGNRISASAAFGNIAQPTYPQQPYTAPVPAAPGFGQTPMLAYPQQPYAAPVPVPAGYGQPPAPVYPQQPYAAPAPAAPGYGQPPAPAYPQQPTPAAYPQQGYGQPQAPAQAYPQQPVQIDPITGKPYAGPVMGI